jgi:predicted nucleic acid-binding protein
MKRLRVYVDTSVIGGCLDEEFANESLRLMDAIRQEKLIMLLSDLVISELENAPPQVQEILQALPPAAIEAVELTTEVIQLREAYLTNGIVSKKSRNDATHVAAATISRADAIVSWNFKHIVRLDKMKAYNQVNLLNGYGILTIISPKEVILDDSDKSTEDI